jgi:hypothetical protein
MPSGHTHAQKNRPNTIVAIIKTKAGQYSRMNSLAATIAPIAERGLSWRNICGEKPRDVRGSRYIRRQRNRMKHTI